MRRLLLWAFGWTFAVLLHSGCRQEPASSGILDTSETWDAIELARSTTKVALCHDEGGGSGHVIVVGLEDAKRHLRDHNDDIRPARHALKVGEPCECNAELPPMRSKANTPAPKIAVSCNDDYLDDDGDACTMPDLDNGGAASCANQTASDVPIAPPCFYVCKTYPRGQGMSPYIKCWDSNGNCDSYVFYEEQIGGGCYVQLQETALGTNHGVEYVCP